MQIFDFRTLGTIDLRPADGGSSSSVVTQPKRLALLAYLVLARPRGSHSRDHLLPLFWPEFDERRGRGALSQSLYFLRNALGDESIRSRGPQEVMVDRAVVRSDAEDFERLVAEEEPGAAFQLYRGELLNGLHVPGCLDFSQWLDVERARMRRLARDAAAQAATAECERSPGASIRLLHRALELFPTDERLFRALVDVLARTGDRFGVERAYEEFRRRLREDLDAEPSEETRRLVERIKRPAPGNGPAVASQNQGGDIRSIAVLPLRSARELGGYTPESMTEALIGELGKIRSLRVISHQSVRRFQGSRQPLAEIADILDVDALVEGMVTEGGDRTRVSAQLVRAVPEEHLWSGAFEAEVGDVLTVHRDIAQAIATAVSAAITQDERSHLARKERVDPAAYEAYLQGWMKHSTVVPADIARAAELYQEAIQIDPDFAPPRAILGVIYFDLMGFGELSEADGLPLMVRTLERAFELDPEIWHGYTARGLLHMARHDWYAAEEDLDRAARLAPNEAMAHTHRTLLLTGLGRFEEARAAAEKAWQVGPLTPFAHWIAGWASHYARRPGAAINQLRRALKLFPDYPMAWPFLAKCYYQSGDVGDARAACLRSLELMPENPMVLGYTTHILAAIGDRDRADRVMARLEAERDKRGALSPYYSAAALCGLGRIEEAFEELGRIRRGAAALAFILPVDPLLDPLRDDPRFRVALQRVGLQRWPREAGPEPAVEATRLGRRV